MANIKAKRMTIHNRRECLELSDLEETSKSDATVRYGFLLSRTAGIKEK